MQIRFLGILAVLAVLGVAPLPAVVGFAAGGGSSWSQRFGNSLSGGFDFIGVEMTSPGDTFVSPTFREFNDASWTFGRGNDSVFPTIASAKGDEVTDLRFDLAFEGTMSDPFDFELFSFLGEEAQSVVTVSWDGAEFSFTEYVGGDGFPGDMPERAHFVPTPAALPVGLVMFGVLGLAWRPWHRRRMA